MNTGSVDRAQVRDIIFLDAPTSCAFFHLRVERSDIVRILLSTGCVLRIQASVTLLSHLDFVYFSTIWTESP